MEDVENWQSEKTLDRKLAFIIVFLVALFTLADDSTTCKVIFFWRMVAYQRPVAIRNT